jgi:hypothetical protein
MVRRTSQWPDQCRRPFRALCQGPDTQMTRRGRTMAITRPRQPPAEFAPLHGVGERVARARSIGQTPTTLSRPEIPRVKAMLTARSDPPGTYTERHPCHQRARKPAEQTVKRAGTRISRGHSWCSRQMKPADRAAPSRRHNSAALRFEACRPRRRIRSGKVTCISAIPMCRASIRMRMR